MRWWVGDDSLAGALDGAGSPVYQAVIEIKGAWRRDYSWGALFNEQWRSSATDSWRGAPVADGDFDCSAVEGSNNPILSGVQCFESGTNLIQSAQDYSSYQIKFITGVGFQGLNMPPTQRQCVSPLHKGAVGLYSLGRYGGPGPTLGNLDNSMALGFWGVSANENRITADITDDFDADLGALFPAANISEVGMCAPWAESYGFFFGDGSYADEVVVSVTDIDFDRGLVGNSLRATSQLIVHNYTAPYDNTGGGVDTYKPWVAYWTGGNRITQLQNNADGRYRLEIDIRFLTSCVGGSCNIITNKSPIVAQIPVMPIVYPASGIANFQVAAYDPDFGDRKDQVRFFVGTPQEHGYILANYVRYRDVAGGPVLEDATYYEDAYHLRICEKGVGAADVCTDSNLIGPNKVVAFGPNYSGNPLLAADNTTLYPKWDPTVNIAHAPIDINNNTLTIGSRNGMVTWEVGTSLTTGIAPGFYQVTIMVEERMESSFWDSIDADTVFRSNWGIPGSDYYAGYDLTTGSDRRGNAGGLSSTGSTLRGAGPKVPVDFMMYLYPAMHYCSSNCDRSSSGNIMQTFEAQDGLYGDPELDSRPGDGLSGPGTGSCKICGGGGSYTDIPGDSGMRYIDAVKDSLSYCQVINTPTSQPIQTAYSRGYDNETGVAEYGLWRASLTSAESWKDYGDTCNIVTTTFTSGQNCLESGTCTDSWVFQGCLGISYDSTTSIIPYDGIFETCQINNPPRFITECDCGEAAWLSQTGANPVFTPSAQNCLYNMRSTGIERSSFGSCCSTPIAPLTFDTPSTALYAGMFYPGTVRGILGQDLFFDLVATDDDQCVELTICDTGFPSKYMALGVHARVGPRTVKRRFSFNPPSWVNGTADLDPRPTFSRVCFYATDKYLLTSYPFHCINIELVPPVAAKWCDEDASDGTPAPDASSVTATPQPYKVLRSYINETIELPLCVYKTETPNVEHNMAILPVTEESPGMYPNLYNFSYPVDQINFPPQWSGPVQQSIAPVTTPGWYFAPTLDSAGNQIVSADPLWRTWTFTPDETQECVYTVCFRGADVESANMEDPTLSPTQFTSVRCYRIEVYNSVLEFAGESEARVPGLSEAVYIKDGFSMSVWAYPECVSKGTNMTLMYFGSTRHFQTQQGYYGGDTGLPIRNGIKWAQTGEEVGRFYYEDCRVGIKAAPAQYACDMWHFVAFTVDEEHHAMFYVDGEKPTQRDPYSLHHLLSTQLTFVTPSRPDTPDDITTGTGLFVVGSYEGGQSMVGALDDLYVWNRALSAEEVGTVMRSRTLYGNDAIQEALLAWFPMRDGTGGADLPLADYSGVGAGPSGAPFQLASTGTVDPVVVDMATPVVVPCVRGLEMPVGPTDGTCTQAIYGWNFARAPWTAVAFGDIRVPATFVNDTELKAETPGYVSPQFVSVTASNDGQTFTNVVGVGRDTRFLYLDAGLYMDGSGGGASADSVCLDLPDRSVTFGAWVCVDCGQPGVHYDAPDPGSPNPKPEDPPQPPVDHILKPLYDLGLKHLPAGGNGSRD